MHTYLFRHGIAEDRKPDGTDDDRALTAEGIEKTARAARGLATLDIKVDLILTSPKLRAKQTAEILAEVFQVKVREDERLATSSEARDLEAIFDADVENLIVVGHQPDLALVAELAVFGDTVGRIELKKAGCIGLEMAQIRGRKPPVAAVMNFILPPRVLRALAQTD